MVKRWIEGEVVRIKKVGSKTKHFDIKIEEGVALDFVPGQFVTFDLPIGEKRLDRWRSYSIASPSMEDGIFSLCIVELEGGKGSTYFHHDVVVGTKLVFKKPQGVFTLPHANVLPLVFICTGTGVAPFRSMIQSLSNEGSFKQSVHLIFGTRHKDDILYREEFEALAANESLFQYDVVLSKEQQWDGFKGHVHQVYESNYDGQSEALFYLCGWSMMVDEAKERLLRMGIPASKIIVELYG